MAGKNIKLKDGTGVEIDYTGVPKIKIPAADGGGDVIFQLPPTMQEKSVSITSNGTIDVIPDSGYDAMTKVTVTTNVAGGGGGGGADVSNWGDAEGEGCIIYSPDGISINVYGKTIQNLGLLDNTNYITWLQSDWSLSQTSLQTELDAWAAKIMTPGTAENTRFTSVFNGATKAIFMWNDKKIECEVPSFQDSDPKTYAGLVGALKRTLSTNNYALWNQNVADNCITEYGNGYDHISFTHVSFPFVWSPAQSVGYTAKYMTLQTPIETVPDLSLLETSVLPLTEVFYLNVQMANVFYPLEGSDVQYTALIIGNIFPTDLYSYSYGAQTVTYQNTTIILPQGWGKLTASQEGLTFSAITEADMQTEFGNNGGFDTVGYLSVSSYDTSEAPEGVKQTFESLKKWVLSFFKLQEGELYKMKSGANRFEMRFNLAKVQS